MLILWPPLHPLKSFLNVFKTASCSLIKFWPMQVNPVKNSGVPSFKSKIFVHGQIALLKYQRQINWHVSLIIPPEKWRWSIASLTVSGYFLWKCFPFSKLYINHLKRSCLHLLNFFCEGSLIVDSNFILYKNMDILVRTKLDHSTSHATCM